jgi:hypothetical protein
MNARAWFQVDGGVVFEYEMKIFVAPVHPGREGRASMGVRRDSRMPRPPPSPGLSPINPMGER